MKKKKRPGNRQKQALVARQRVYQPWPSFLDFNSDDDFYDWYSGEVVPSPEVIFQHEMLLIDKRAEEMIDETFQLASADGSVCRLAFPGVMAR